MEKFSYSILTEIDIRSLVTEEEQNVLPEELCKNIVEHTGELTDVYTGTISQRPKTT